MVDQRALTEALRRQAGVVSAPQLAAFGVSSAVVARRVAAGRLFRVRYRVYAVSPYLDIWGRRWAALLSLSGESVLSHWSAAALHGLVPEPAGAPHVTLVGIGRRRVAGINVHRTREWRPRDVVRVRGLRVTGVERTILDIAPRSSERVVRRVIREAEFLGLLPAGAMALALQNRPGSPGVRAVRHADPASRPSALRLTPIEDDLARLIAGLPTPPPTTQFPLVGQNARYRADFAWPALRLLVEADSRVAHARPSSFEADRARDADLAATGWLTLRFTTAQIRDAPGEVEDRIVRTAMSRGWEAGEPRHPARPGQR